MTIGRPVTAVGARHCRAPTAVTFAGCKLQPIDATINSVDLLPSYDHPIHSRRSIRLPGYDYTQPGCYFITICAAGRQGIFGEITSKETCLVASPIGEFVNECWATIPLHFPNVILDEYVLMPNHLHGILQIADLKQCGHRPAMMTANAEAFGKPVPRSISTIIRSFKSIVSRRVIDKGLGVGLPVWQRNYYERVIRSEHDLNEIRKYISENPTNWSHDPDNPTAMNPDSSL